MDFHVNKGGTARYSPFAQTMCKGHFCTAENFREVAFEQKIYICGDGDPDTGRHLHSAAALCGA